MSKKLLVIEIEKFAIHDGPGIRTLVFLQGCPLNCKWCSNPESQSNSSQLFYMKKKCIGCGICVDYSEDGAAFMHEGYPVFDRIKKHDWKESVKHCPTGALRLSSKWMDIEELVDIVIKDEAYYKKTGGGITISGGEPFVQFEGLRELLKFCKSRGINTILETSGHVLRSKLEDVLPFVDGFLIDLKHVNREKMLTFTGVDGSLIEENMMYLKKVASEKVTIRIPVIPTFNYSMKDMKEIFNKVKDIGYAQVVLLPYHTLGLSKYEQLELDYDIIVRKALNKKDLKAYVNLGKQMGLEVHI